MATECVRDADVALTAMQVPRNEQFRDNDFHDFMTTFVNKERLT
jgi:hypothetical protein